MIPELPTHPRTVPPVPTWAQTAQPEKPTPRLTRAIVHRDGFIDGSSRILSFVADFESILRGVAYDVPDDLNHDNCLPKINAWHNPFVVPFAANCRYGVPPTIEYFVDALPVYTTVPRVTGPNVMA